MSSSQLLLTSRVLLRVKQSQVRHRKRIVTMIHYNEEKSEDFKSAFDEL